MTKEHENQIKRLREPYKRRAVHSCLDSPVSMCAHRAISSRSNSAARECRKF